jgi:hypothetical protein
VVVFQNTGLLTGFGFDLTTPLASFFAFDAGFTGGVRVAAYGFTLPHILLTTGPGGAGFAKAVDLEVSDVPVDTGFAYVPFDLSPRGLFPSQ